MLMIDDDAKFYKTLKSHLSTTVDCSIEWYRELDDKVALEHDVYVVGNHLNGGTRTLEIIKQVLENDPTSMVYVISQNGDYDFLKSLFKAGVSGFLDKNQLDVEPLLKACKKTLRNKKRLTKLSSRLDAIS